MTNCLCVRLRVDDAASATIRVNDPPAVTFGAGEYVPYVPQVDEYQGPYEVTPTETAQVLETNTLKMDDDVTVDAIPSDYVGSAIERRDATDLSAAGATVSVPAGYYESATSASVASGTAGTPTASKTVSGHTATVTPSVTNTTGYITGGTKTGTGVTVTASELVSGTYTVTASGTHDVTQYASASVAAATPTNSSDSEYVTSSGVRKWRYRPKTIVPTAGWAAQRSASNPINGFWQTFDAIPSGTTVTPTTSSQTIGGADTMLEGSVTVAAIPPEYIVPTGTKSIAANGTGIDVTEYASVDVAVQDSTLIVTLSWDDDYFGVDDGAWVPDCTIYELHDADVGGKDIALECNDGSAVGWYWDDDYVFVYAVYSWDGNSLKESYYVFTVDGVEHGVDTETIVPAFDSPTRTYTPTTSQQTDTITYDPNDGYNGIQQVSVTVNAMPTGTAGTPTATKGAVSNHSVSVTPSVTNTTGYITGGTVSGTAVSVTASELVSGTKSISANGTGIDVTEYAAVDVAVPSSAPTLQAKTNIAPTTSSQTITADAGYDGLSSVQIDSMPSGVVVPASSISTSGGAAITTETGKIVLTKTVSNVPQVTTAGYVTSGTFGNTAVTLRADCSINDSSSLTQSGNTVTAAAGYYPSTATLTVSGGSSVKTATGTFTGNGTRTIDVTCTFEPDIVYFTSNPGTTASSGTVAAIIVRDMMAATRYRNNSTTNSHYAIPGIANLNTSGSSYSWRATYANSKVTLYCYSSNARGLLTNGRTYSYTFIKWT